MWFCAIIPTYLPVCLRIMCTKRMAQTLFLASIYHRGFYAANYLPEVSEEVLPLVWAALVTRGVFSPAKQVLTMALILKLWEVSKVHEAIDNLRVKTGTVSGKPLENGGYPGWLKTAWVAVSCTPILDIDGCMSR